MTSITTLVQSESGGNGNEGVSAELELHNKVQFTIIR